VPFFFKQWGGTQKKKAGRILQGRTHDDMPPRGQRPVAQRTVRQAWVEELSSGSQDKTFPLALVGEQGS